MCHHNSKGRKLEDTWSHSGQRARAASQSHTQAFNSLLQERNVLESILNRWAGVFRIKFAHIFGWVLSRTCLVLKSNLQSSLSSLRPLPSPSTIPALLNRECLGLEVRSENLNPQKHLDDKNRETKSSLIKGTCFPIGLGAIILPHLCADLWKWPTFKY